jgi:hypothetical protein
MRRATRQGMRPAWLLPEEEQLHVEVDRETVLATGMGTATATGSQRRVMKRIMMHELAMMPRRALDVRATMTEEPLVLISRGI